MSELERSPTNLSDKVRKQKIIQLLTLSLFSVTVFCWQLCSQLLRRIVRKSLVYILTGKDTNKINGI